MTATIDDAPLTHTRQHEPDDFATSRLLTVLDTCWRDICRRHPDLPAAVIVVASGTEAGTPRFGHYASMRWQHGDHRIAEVLISGEGLLRPAADVFATLLHEAAHALADARDIQDTSRQGRWHNGKFAELANELGLDATKTDKFGWAATTLRADTARRYRRLIDRLARTQGAYRHPEPAKTGKEKTSTNPPPCTCECPRKIRVASAVLAEGPITCGVCDTDFTPDLPDSDTGNEDSSGDEA